VGGADTLGCVFRGMFDGAVGSEIITWRAHCILLRKVVSVRQSQQSIIAMAADVVDRWGHSCGGPISCMHASGRFPMRHRVNSSIPNAMRPPVG
jgi:hypothetical protein